MTFRRALALFAATASAVIVTDQATKALVRAGVPLYASIPVLDRAVFLTHVRNTGGAFSILAGRYEIFMTAAVLVIVGIVIHMWVVRSTDIGTVVPLGLLAGGAAGNLVDRILFSGQVTDFIDIRILPVFNVADTCVVIGVFFLAIRLLFTEEAGDGEAAPAGAAPGDSGGPQA